jgi:hypothetical protein
MPAPHLLPPHAMAQPLLDLPEIPVQVLVPALTVVMAVAQAAMAAAAVTEETKVKRFTTFLRRKVIVKVPCAPRIP